MDKLIRVNIQTYVDGMLLPQKTYPAEQFSSAGLSAIQEYIKEQELLPLDKRDKPPVFAYVGEEETNSEKQVINYSEMTNEQLKDLCKQRGIECKSNSKKDFLINQLEEYDLALNGEEQESEYYNADDFSKLTDKEKIDYLDYLAGLDGEEVDDEELVATLQSYGGLSLSEEIIEKVKELLDFYNV